MEIPFEEASLLLDRNCVEAARKLHELGDDRGSCKELLEGVKKEVRRVRDYAVTGMLAADTQALISLQRKLATGMLCADIKKTFPKVGDAVVRGATVARGWEWISGKIGTRNRLWSKAVTFVLAGAPTVIDIVKNKNGMRDDAVRTCESVKATVEAYAGDIYHTAKEMVKTGVNYAVSFVHDAVETIHRGLSVAGETVKRGWNWLKNLVRG